MFNAPSKDHFAAVGKTVESSWDLGSRGVVMGWVSDYEFAVRWDNGLWTVCTVHDVEPVEVVVIEPSTLDRIHRENPEIPAAEIDLAIERQLEQDQ